MSARTPELTQAERSALLAVARAAIGEKLLDDGRLGRTLERLEITGPLAAQRGLFVTLTVPADPSARDSESRLRGCIGTMKGSGPLYLAVAETARSAAFDDPRFPPLGLDELDEVRLEISVLSPTHPVDDWRRIELGVDGVQLDREPHRAVFLPQVALEQGWELQQLLRQLSLKAGLPPDGWRSAGLSTFRTESFSERHRPSYSGG
jgi:hypothetical protein